MLRESWVFCVFGEKVYIFFPPTPISSTVYCQSLFEFNSCVSQLLLLPVESSSLGFVLYIES